jgi:hypothetical protein
VDLQCLGQHVVDREAMVTNFLPQCLFGLGLVEVDRRRVGMAQPLLRGCDGDVRGGRCNVGCRGLGITRWVLRHHGAVLPHHQHLWRALGGWPGSPPRLAPPRGASSSATAPTAPWSPVGRLSERSYPRPQGGTRGTSVCDVAAASSSCCGLAVAVVTRDGSPVAAALAAVRGTISEHCLVVASVPNLSALAGTRAGTVRVTLSAKKMRK